MSGFDRKVRRKAAKRLGLPVGFFCKKSQDKARQQFLKFQKTLEEKYSQNQVEVPDGEVVDGQES